MNRRQQILNAHPIRSFMERRSIKLAGNGKQLKGVCPFHDDHDPSMSVNEEKGVFHCFVCGAGGTVIDFVMRHDGVSCKDAMEKLADEAGIQPDENPRKISYSYRNATGHEVMKVERIEQGKKKRFLQSRTDSEGNRVNNLDGVERPLFRMERWSGKDEVALCEGEKCVAALERVGIDATCNAGGSGSWQDRYASYLVGKHVDIWPDNDEAGEKWLASVLSSLEGKVASLRVLHVPDIYNDVADVVIAQGTEMATETVLDIMSRAERIDRGVIMPLLSASECYSQYVDSVTRADTECVNLANWLPSFRKTTRPLYPSDMMLVLSDTGVGKTTMLVSLANAMRPLPIVFFELELSPSMMAERFTAATNQTPSYQVESDVKRGKSFASSGWNHVFVCPSSRLSVPDMEEIVMKSEAKIGRHPAIVMIDYIGLTQGAGRGRYEQLSGVAEDLKRMARATRTVVVVCSQLKRDPSRIEVELNDGKDSGSLENSAQLVLGAWRPDKHRITVKILKQTRKAASATIECNFDGDRQIITERFFEKTA